jgi:hypothetical protein
VRLLLAQGASPNTRIDYRSPVDGRSDSEVVALMFASSPEVVSLLRGPGPKLEREMVLMHQVGRGTPGVFETLIRAGADPSARAKDGRSAADMVLKTLDWWRRFAPGKAPEHCADLERILSLLQAPA